MIKQNVKLYELLIILLVLCICVSSCKKSPQDTSTEQSEQSTTNQTISEIQENDSATANMIPLETELPKPMFVGTPTNILGVTNLEEPRPQGTLRPTLYVPEGTTNVALNKSISATDEQPIIGTMELITDGDKEAMDGSYVELAPFRQHITIDLEQEYEIYAILIWHYHKQARVYFDVIVQLANDPDFLIDVKTIFNNDLDNSSEMGVGQEKHYIETSEGKLIDVKGQRARYVRLYSNGSNANELNHYIEVEVFGKLVK
ncbi:MAG: hypothetical protein ACYTFM_02450 [Planctomycetota bacterium]|jgi:hypothetical protein